MPKKVAIMQPYFFPYIGYWQAINAVDEYVLYDDVTYIKGGWINRNNILLNGQSHLITLPLENSSSFKLINEIYVTSNVKIKEKLSKTIYMAYSKAPYFEQVYPIIEKSIMKSGIISEIIYENVLDICEYLGIKTKILLSSKIDKISELKAEEKVINIVKNLGGMTYVNAIGGRELYSKENFNKNNIDLYFIKTHSIEYKQFKNQFVANLSIIDILMFNSIEEVRELLNKYELI